MPCDRLVSAGEREGEAEGLKPSLSLSFSTCKMGITSTAGKRDRVGGWAQKGGKLADMSPPGDGEH